MATRTAKASRSAPVKTADKPREEGPISRTPLAHQPLSADEIRVCAYLRWEAAGKPPGDGTKFWLEAEQELLQGK
jgi:hypothetical protein